MSERRFSRRGALRFGAVGALSAASAFLDARRSFVKSVSSDLVVPEQVAPNRSRVFFPNVTKGGGFGGAYDGGNVAVGVNVTREEFPKSDVLPKKVEYQRETKLIARKPDWSEKILRDPHALLELPVTEPLVALTIDDGFGVRMEMLNVLSDLGVTATLCMEGDRTINLDRKFIEVASKSELIEWGNHTWRHHDMRNNSEAELIEDIMHLERLLNEYGQTSLPYLRPPGGGMSDWTMRVGADLGFKHIYWSASGDAGGLTGDELLNYYLAAIRPGGIILIHFIPKTYDMLPKLVRGIRAKGLQPTALSNVIARTDPEYWKSIEKKAA